MKTAAHADDKRPRGALRGGALILSLGLALLVAGCGKPGVGDNCKQDGDCAAVGTGARCLGANEGFPSGYCSIDCSATACGEKQICTPLLDDGPPLCLSGCSKSSDCHDGAQCYEGRCQPKCKVDTDCRSEGHVCQEGACAERPGKKPGETCAADSDCQYQACIAQKCALGCQREPVCGEAQTCALDRDATKVRGSCIDRRSAATKTPMVSCTEDAQCKQGSCVMGVCLVLCQRASDCATAGDGASTMQCVELPAPLRKLSTAKWPRMKGCLPANSSVTATYKANDTMLVPATGRSATFVMTAPDVSDSVEVGMQWINDASGKDVYVVPSPTDPDGYFRNAIRHQPNLGSSTLLLSGAPQRVVLASSAYPFQAFGVNAMNMNVEPSVTVVYKLADVSPAKQTTARVPLRIHITDVSGLPAGCSVQGLKASNAATVLQPMVSKLQAIWGQGNAGITFDPITFVDSDAPSSIDANSDTGLGRALQAASKNSGGGADLVLVRAINPNGVLGIAGGIPSAPAIKNNPRTGAVFAMSLLCIPAANYTLQSLGQTAAHELGHAFGLSHGNERDGHGDPLGTGTGPSESTQQGKMNLMYWSAEGGESLTAEQGQVLRSMPQVR